MLRKLKIPLLLLLTAVIIFSCTKHNNDQPVTPPQSELSDTLGSGWQRIQLDSTLNFDDIFFVNSQVGFVCGTGYVGKSTDGGLTWKQTVPDSLREYFINLFFIDVNNGWVTGQNFLLRTKDGGASWQKINKPGTFDVQFFDANNGFISASGGLYKTTDGGITQVPVSGYSGGSANGLFFFDQNIGWYTNNYLYKTRDSGKTFSTSFITVGQGEYAIQFTDTLHGWIAGGAGVYRTVDAGATLERLTGGSTDGSDIQFFDNNNGFILSDDHVYSTADGGKTLSQICAMHKSGVDEIHFTDMNHGWAGGTKGYVYRYVKP